MGVVEGVFNDNRVEVKEAVYNMNYFLSIEFFLLTSEHRVDLNKKSNIILP